MGQWHCQKCGKKVHNRDKTTEGNPEITHCPRCNAKRVKIPQAVKKKMVMICRMPKCGLRLYFTMSKESGYSEGYCDACLPLARKGITEKPAVPV